ncbi:MAG: DoxX family protein [Saprospiraceae bacterium]|nr:DoxX family protein [Saprospiraceae bacterium]
MNLKKVSFSQLFFTDIASSTLFNWTILLYRIIVSIAMIGIHGLTKIINFSEEVNKIPDPFNMGGEVALTLAIIANIGCTSLIILGLFTRFSAFFILCLTFTGLVVVHAADPWVVKDIPLMYSLAFGLILLLGPGKFALDTLIYKRMSK